MNPIYAVMTRIMLYPLPPPHPTPSTTNSVLVNIISDSDIDSYAANKNIPEFLDNSGILNSYLL